MKILIVSKNFYPENLPRAFRASELARELSRKGHSVSVFTPLNSEYHPGFSQQTGVEILDLGQLKWRAITIGKSTGPVKFIKRLVTRMLTLLVYYPDIELLFRVKKALLRHKKSYDLLISIAAPHSVHWGITWVLKKNKKLTAKWIADCGDPFMGGENDTFKRLPYFSYPEKWFCRRADFITVPILGAIPAYYPEFKSKIRIIPQGFDFSAIPKPNPGSKNPIPTFAYAGSLIPRIRDPKSFFECILAIREEFQFHVYTSSVDYLLPYKEKSRGRIILHNFLPRQDLLVQLSTMDFVVNFENIGMVQSPSKLIDYALIGKPILSVKTFGFSDRVLKEFFKGDYTNQYQIDDVDQYNIENVAKSFCDLAE